MLKTARNATDSEGESYMRSYELGRTLPFQNSPKGYYSTQDIAEAYFNWATAVPGKRTLEWEYYCDARDGYAPGTNTEMRRKYEKQQQGQLNEPRYVNLAGK